MQFLAFNSGISNDGSMKLHSDETLSSRILDFLARDSDKCFFVMRLSQEIAQTTTLALFLHLAVIYQL